MHELRNAAAGQSTPSTPRAAAEVQVLRCFRSHLEDGGEGGSPLFLYACFSNESAGRLGLGGHDPGTRPRAQVRPRTAGQGPAP